MKIPGWWRVSYFYDRRVEDLIEFDKNFQNFKVGISFRYTKWKLDRSKLLNGVNIIGFAKGDFGIAQSMRLVTDAMKTTNVSFSVNNSGDTGEHSTTNEELTPYLTKDAPYLINLFTYNADLTISYCEGAFFTRDGSIPSKKQYNIGYGYWELSIFPVKWQAQDKYLNEIWAPSKFIQGLIEKYSTLPIRYIPLPVDFKIPEGYTRSQFNLSEDSMLYLFTFDMSSSVERKNPQAVITAFCSAFPVEGNEQVSLVIKVNRVQNREDQALKVEALRQQIAFDPRIQIIDKILDRSSILGLIYVCDCYVSLHRAEGFGLGIAEAMKMSKVVIATNYSGNTDFMNEENSCLVNYTLIPVNKNEYVHVEDGAVWADPDVDQAASYMKKVYEDKGYVKKKAEAAKLYIDTHHSFEAIGKAYQQRLLEILHTAE